MFQNVPDRIELRTPALGRTVTLLSADWRSAVVWNPWPAKTARLSQMAADDWQQFVCVESANVHDHTMQLAPGERRELTLRLRCESR